MSTNIKLKRSAIAGKIPATADLDLGELAINTFDGKLFLKKDDGTESIIDVTSGGDIAPVDIQSFTYDSVNGVLTITESDSTAFTANLDLNAFSTTDLSEGTNLYFTDARSRNTLSASGDLSYNSTTGVFSVTTYKTTDFDNDFSSKSTTDLSEGTNLYFTTARANNAIDNRVTKTFVDALDVDANTLDGANGSFYLDYNNFSNTPTDSDTTYDLISPGSGIIRLSDNANSNDDIIVVGSGATTVTSNTTHIIVSSTDNNTTYSAGDGLSLLSTTFNVGAGNGIAVNADDVEVNVSGDTSLIANNSGLFIDDSTLTIATSQLTGDIVLGTQTLGNYIATITGTANEIEVTGSGSETAAVTIGLPNDVTIGNNLIVSGNLTVSGTVTNVNTETINLADNIITLNSNEAGIPSQNAGIEVERGADTNVILQWNEASDYWEIASGGTTGRILTTSDEGAGNGLDADTLDGQQGSYYLDWSNVTNKPDPTVTLTGAVTGSATMTDLGSISIATTATADPSLTINGDASGSATFTNLGNATLTLTIADDSHNHTVSTITDFTTGANTAIDNRVTKTFVDALNVDADTLDSLNSTQFLRSDTSDTMSGSLTVTGDLTVNTDTLYVDSVNNRIGVGTSSPSAKLDVAGDIQVNSLFNINAESGSTTSTTQTTIATFSAATYSSAKFVVQAKDGVTDEVHVSELLVVHDGTAASATEYGTIHTGVAPLATYDVDISSGNVRLLATAASTNSTTYKVTENLITA